MTICNLHRKKEHYMNGNTNNQILLNELLKQEFEEDETFGKEDDYFEYFAANQVLKKYDLSDDEIEKGQKGSGNDGGCDGIYIFANGMLVDENSIEIMEFPKETKLEMVFIQAKRSSSFGEDAIMKWKTISNNLLQMENNVSEFKSRYNEDVLNSFQLFRDLYIKLIRKKCKLKFLYFYVSTGIEVHPNVKEQGNELKQIIKKLFPPCNVEVCFVGANELMELINISEFTEFNLVMTENPISIGDRKDYVALVNLAEFYNFITDENDNIFKHIFEANVRDYQGNVAVNAEIQETLQNESEEDFWWLNNGITIIASEISLKTGKILLISNPEIVNGLQTSTEIYNYFTKNPTQKTKENRNVLVRIMVPNDEASRDKIILATNNQTAIPKSSLRASDAVHLQIEMYFKSRGLYYDRRKNYYKNLGKKSSEIVSVSFLAQCLISILLQKPDYSRARPSTVLTNDEYYKKLYVDNEDLVVFYNAVAIGRKVNLTIKKMADFEKVEKGDILFYVIYYVAALITKKTVMKANDLKKIDLSILTENMIEKCSKDVYELYKNLGGNGKVAKGTEMIKELTKHVEVDLIKNKIENV